MAAATVEALPPTRVYDSPFLRPLQMMRRPLGPTLMPNVVYLDLPGLLDHIRRKGSVPPLGVKHRAEGGSRPLMDKCRKI